MVARLFAAPRALARFAAADMGDASVGRVVLALGTCLSGLLSAGWSRSHGAPYSKEWRFGTLSPHSRQRPSGRVHTGIGPTRREALCCRRVTTSTLLCGCPNTVPLQTTDERTRMVARGNPCERCPFRRACRLRATGCCPSMGEGRAPSHAQGKLLAARGCGETQGGEGWS